MLSGILPYSEPFNSRPHEEVDEYSLRFYSCISPFNSRPHEEVDAIRGFALYFPGVPFNSRPHEEVDVHVVDLVCLDDSLSTHDLTRRST